MKKAVVIFLVSLTVVFSAGHFLVYKVFSRQYKKEFRQYMYQHSEKAENMLIHADELYKNTAGLIWEDENKEIIYKGRLYDVAAVVPQGKQVLLKIVRDDQERQMKKEFASLYEQQNDQGSNGLFKVLKQLLSMKYLSSDNSYTVFNDPEAIVFTHPPGTDPNAPVLSVPVPPPDLA